MNVLPVANETQQVLRSLPRTPLTPVVARRMLRFELERLCAETGVRHSTIATWLGVSRASVTQALTGKNLFSRPALEVLLMRLNRLELGVRLDGLRCAARAGRPVRTTGTTDWQSPRDAELAIGLEAFAEKLSVFDPWQAPLHLQTSAYAAALGSEPEGDTRRALITDDDALTFSWVTLEQALHRRVGSSEVMRDQLTHLVRLAHRPNVSVHVIPAGTELPMVRAGFQLIWGTPPVVVEPGQLTTRYAHKPETVAYFARLLDGLQRRALDPEASAALIAGLAQQVER